MIIKPKYMQEAIKQAYKGLIKNQWPIGAVIVLNDHIIAKAHNNIILDPTAHAEILAAKQALYKLQSKYLNDCIVYVTQEPCMMCYYTLSVMRIKAIVFGCENNGNDKHELNKIPKYNLCYENTTQKLVQQYAKKLRYKD